MGWGTEFTTDIYLNRMAFNSKYELDDKITAPHPDPDASVAI